MHRFGVALGLVGVAAWFVAQTLVAFAMCVVLAVPFGVLLVFDALADDPGVAADLRIVPPAPPRQPVTARPERLAA